MGRYLRILLTVAALLSVQSLHAAASGAEDASSYVKRFEKRYRAAATLRTDFLERYSTSGRLDRAESGVAYFKRPGKMRWEYQAPEQNLFLIDGKTAWFYVPADHTVTRMPAKKSGDWRTPFALLAGKADVSRICGKVEIDAGAQPSDHSLVMLRCEVRGAKATPEKQDGQGDLEDVGAELVQFELVRDTGELRKVVVHQRGGVQVEFAFKNWEFNPSVAESKFHFAAPPGVAIVNGETAAEDSGTK